MNITQKQAVAAYKALEKLSDQPMGWKTSYWVMKLKKKLKLQNDFQNECERKLVEKYKPTILANGRMKLETAEKAREFDAEWAEIGNIELTDLKFQKIVISEFENLKLSPSDIEALEEFVEFDVPEDEEEAEAPAELKPIAPEAAEPSEELVEEAESVDE